MFQVFGQENTNSGGKGVSDSFNRELLIRLLLMLFFVCNVTPHQCQYESCYDF